MSQIGQYISIKAITPVESLTGNIGGPVGPDGAGNIDTIGAGNIFATGNPATHTMTFTLVGTTNHAIQIGNAAGSLTSLPVAANGQIPIGSVGADPVIANITPGNGIVVTNGAGSITLSVDGAVVVTTLHTDDGNNVTPTLGVINIHGTNGITTTGTVGPNTVTLANDGTLAASFPTDSGTATPVAGVLHIITDNAIVNAGSSVLFTAPGASNTVQLNVTDASANTLIGDLCGNLTLTGIDNTGLGESVLSALTSGHDNTAIGLSALRSCTSGFNNVAVGVGSQQHLVDGQNNVSIGIGSLQTNVHGSFQTALGNAALQNFDDTGSPANVAIGSGALLSLTAGEANTTTGFGAGGNLLTGVWNCLLGAIAGDNYVGAESSNVIISNIGVAAEDNTIRIGTQGVGNGQQDRCFIAGIATVAVANTEMVTIDTTTGQLGSQAIMPPSGVTWSVIVADQTAVVNEGYFCNKAGTLALALPAASAVGDVIEVTNENTALGVQFTQAAGQQILYGNTNTTLGGAGTLTSSAVGDTLKIVCYVANTIWRVTSSMGNWTPA